MDILKYLQESKAIYLRELSAVLDDFNNTFGKLTPESGLMYQELIEYLKRGGKWHRPALAELSYIIKGGKQIQKVRRIFLALELTHRYLLIHDDIMDRDYIRHGGDTIEKRYQNSFAKKYKRVDSAMYPTGMAIVAGDIVNTLASYCVATCQDLSDTTRNQVLLGLQHLMFETGAGWLSQTEQNFKKISDVSEGEFFKAMQLVSGQYSVVWPLRIGQLAAGVKFGEWSKELDQYGMAAGATFQLTDDLLGMFGNSQETGKPVGHDFREGKKTHLIIYAFNHGGEEDKKFLLKELGQNSTDQVINSARDIMIKTGAVDYVKEAIKKFTKTALNSLDNLDKSQEKMLLMELAEFLGQRGF